MDRYFNTYAGNPVSSTAGLVVLNILERDTLIVKAERRGGKMKAGLEELSLKYPMIGEVRGSGFLLGLEIVDPANRSMPAGDRAKWILNELCRRGILVGRTGPNRRSPNIIKIRPPMVFDDANVDQFIGTLGEILATLESNYLH